MKKMILFLVAMVAVALATFPAALVDTSQPLTTEELLWDDGTYHHSLYEFDRGVWFTMPFDAQVVTARVYIAPATDYDAPFDLLVCPRDGSGLPDDGNPYGTGILNYPGGEATGEGWLDVDLTSLGVNLSSGDEFYLCFYPIGSPPQPYCAYDFNSDGSHNAFDGGSGWSSSSAPAYMFRVIVDDGGSQVELTSWGAIKSKL